MIVQESQNQRLPVDVAAAQNTGRPIRSTLPSANCDVPAGICTPNMPEYTEADYLLPVALYGISRPRRTARTADEGPPAETVCSMLVQILVPFLLAGLGTVFAGLLLEVVQTWDVFQEIAALLILVPALLGMKGNLEMTLASRLSTAVNAGTFQSVGEKWKLIIGNLAVKQLQATMLSLLACVLSTVFGWTTEGKMAFKHVVILCSACISSSFLASLIQGVIMVGFVFGSKRFGFNPDNMATPMAASFGDLLTLALLAGCSFFSYSNIDSYPSVLYLVALFCLCLVPLWVVIASKHPASQALLHTGWTPIIIALVISSIGGLILERTVSDPNLAGIIVYAPIINGIGGNLVSIQSSRISTGLHLNYLPGEVPADRRKCYNPCSIFFGSGLNHRSAQILLLLVIPGQLIFLYSSHLMKGAKTMPSFLLTAAFLAASVIQVFSLLCVADCMVHCLWRRGKDPDSYSIPYLTALGDLLGTALLSLVFLILWWVGDHGSL
eukprot:XP_011605547.1 PREDICTED: solute carrier family 41 member 2-like isoform X1 [Takifugu rubripes]